MAGLNGIRQAAPERLDDVCRHSQLLLRPADELRAGAPRQLLHRRIDVDEAMLEVEARNEIRQVFREGFELLLSLPQEFLHAQPRGDVYGQREARRTAVEQDILGDEFDGHHLAGLLDLPSRGTVLEVVVRSVERRELGPVLFGMSRLPYRQR